MSNFVFLLGTKKGHRWMTLIVDIHFVQFDWV